MRVANTALDNLKHLTIQLKTQPDRTSLVREIPKARKSKQINDKAWIQIIKMNNI